MGKHQERSDVIHIELIKILKDDQALNVILNLFNNIYKTGFIPPDWLKSIFITLPKKASAKYYKDYRTISLMNHILKLFLKIIHNRIYHRCEESIGRSQFGFRNGFDTWEAMFSTQVLIQRCRDVNVDVYVCFVDYEKAFDTIQHEKMVNILEEIRLDGRDIHIIANLYWNQKATVRVDNQMSEKISILRGVRQSCVLSSLLFNLYSERIRRHSRREQRA